MTTTPASPTDQITVLSLRVDGAGLVHYDDFEEGMSDVRAALQAGKLVKARLENMSRAAFEALEDVEEGDTNKKEMSPQCTQQK